MLMIERETDNRLPGDMIARQNAKEGIKRSSYSVLVIEGVRRRPKMFVGDSMASAK